MSYKKELLNLSRRLDQIQKAEHPPELSMVVADAARGETLPEVEDRSPWSLYLKIDKKPEGWVK